MRLPKGLKLKTSGIDRENLTTQPDKALLRLKTFLKSNKKELSPTEKLDLSEIEVFAYLYTN